MTLRANGASRPRRVLLLVTDLEVGGTPTVVRELAIRLNDPPRTVIGVACLSRRGSIANQIESASVRVTPLNASSWIDLPVFARLARLIRSECCDTVLSFLVHANVAAAVVAPLFPAVRFLQSIQTTQPAPRWHWLAQSLAHQAATRVVVPTSSVARVAADWADVPLSKLVVIANAIDPNDFRDTGCQPAAGEREKIAHGLVARATDRPIPIGFIGRLDPIKRIPDLLEAVRLLNGRVHLNVFGDGSQRSVLATRIQELKLERQVTLHGAIARPQEALRKIALLVLPSAAEGFGLVLIEAMVSGVPVVAANAPGICDVVVDGETGLLVPPGSPKGLAKAIDRVLGDAALRNRLVAAARRDVMQRFTWDVVLPRYRALLDL